MGSKNCPDKDPVEILTEAAQAGITAFQYREKGPGSLVGHEKLQLGLKLREVCAKHNVLFFVNDDMDLVEPLVADGIHVGQNDLSPNVIRELLPDIYIGLSISNPDEFQQSPIQVIDYIGAGAVYPTTSKEDADEAVGVKWIQTLKKKVPHLPIVGIGGITPDNAAAVLEAGADGVSFISALTQAKNIPTAVEKL